ncbi:hypothetical protein ALC53_07527 [Atta colombica]|uniref:Uncharacterized protein n=1 Tax=Atta colombica TaxID=520822 RepID=A0A195BCQ7_9HYME|nr:hypothetical protein ALC53_07527 [Atta colombica]
MAGVHVWLQLSLPLIEFSTYHSMSIVSTAQLLRNTTTRVSAGEYEQTTKHYYESILHVRACVRDHDSEFPLGVVADSLTTSLSIEKTQGESKDTLRRDLRAIQGLEFP